MSTEREAHDIAKLLTETSLPEYGHHLGAKAAAMIHRLTRALADAEARIVELSERNVNAESSEGYTREQLAEAHAEIEHDRAWAVWARAEIERKDAALENIAMLDEADGHGLTMRHALEAVAIATRTLEKHPSEIYASRLRSQLAARQPEYATWCEQCQRTMPTSGPSSDPLCRLCASQEAGSPPLPAGPDAARQPSEWQPIETAPKDGRAVDLWVKPHNAFENGNAGRIPNAMFRAGRWVRTLEGDGMPVSKCGSPTHWMPRPAPPSDQPKPCPWPVGDCPHPSVCRCASDQQKEGTDG